MNRRTSMALVCFLGAAIFCGATAFPCLANEPAKKNDNKNFSVNVPARRRTVTPAMRKAAAERLAQKREAALRKQQEQKQNENAGNNK